MFRLGMAICRHGADQANEPTPGVAVPSASLKEAMPGSALLSRHRKVHACPLLSRTMKQLRLCSSMSHGGGKRRGCFYRHVTPSSCKTIRSAVETSATSCWPSAARLSRPANWRQVNFARYSLGRCFSTRIRTSASVASSMTSGMMIGRGNGRDQFGAGRAGPHAKTQRH